MRAGPFLSRTMNEPYPIFRIDQPNVAEVQRLAYNSIYATMPERTYPWKTTFYPRYRGALGLQGPSESWARMGAAWAYRAGQRLGARGLVNWGLEASRSGPGVWRCLGLGLGPGGVRVW